LEQLKPYGEIAKQILPHLPEQACKVLFVEEEIRAGGMGMMLSDALSAFEIMKNKQVSILATEDSFGIQEQNEPIWKTVGVDCDSIVNAVLNS
jgi:deoxyxylulose-5-phosphate synthase